MRKFYIAVNSRPMAAWDKMEQKEFEFRDWSHALAGAKAISRWFDAEVRISTSAGYNNQGTYYMWNNS